MVLHYKRFQVTGSQKSENGSARSWTETGICREDQDPLMIAMARNNDLLKCSRFKVREEPAIEEEVEDPERAEYVPPMVKGYKNLTNRWSDPEYCW